MLLPALCIILWPSGNQNKSCSLEKLNLSQNWGFFVLCDLEIWWMTLKNNRIPLLCYFKLCASFYQQIQTGVTLQKCSIQVKIDILSCATLKYDIWPGKTIGHLFCTTSNFVHHFVAISYLKLDLQSRNVQFGSKSWHFWPLWPWYLTDDLHVQ